MRTSELSAKDVVDISTGQRLGEIIDIDINLSAGEIEGIVIPKQAGLLNLFSSDEDIYVAWDDIHKIGEDVILVKVMGGGINLAE